jgi:hypothetical protein
MFLPNSGVNDKNNGDGERVCDACGTRISRLRHKTLWALLPLSPGRTTPVQHDGGLTPHVVYLLFCCSLAHQRLSNLSRHGFKVIRFCEGFDQRFALTVY